MAEVPYYTVVTRVRERVKDLGVHEISLVTLPAGTILFRGIRLPTENPLAFYTDYLGVPSSVNGTSAFCLKPTHNVFFYAQPLVCFGANNVGKLFDAVQVVVLVKDVNVVCMIRPSTMTRGEGKRYSGNAPIQRCSNFKEACGELTEDDVKALSYDNCLSPDYQRRSSTRGWMAIANLDSIEPKKEDDTGTITNEMASYLKGLEKRQPGVGSLLLASTYVDATRTEKGMIPRTGFPEIVVYPYVTPPSDTNLYQVCKSDVTAMALLAKHVKNDNVLYLPIATITGKGVVDMVGGHFTPSRIQPGGTQHTIETYLIKFLNNSMRYGIRLPYYGNGTISFDTRTGFYILPQVSKVNYKKFVIPMDINTKDSVKRKNAYESYRKYLLYVRQFSLESHMKDIPLPIGNIPNAFIFSRPILLAPIFRLLGISLPKDMFQYLKEASDAYKAGLPLAPIRIPQAPVSSATAASAAASAAAAAYNPGTPIVGQGTPTYGPGTPTYGPGTPNGQGTPTYGPGSPAYVPGSPAYVPGSPNSPEPLVLGNAVGMSEKLKKVLQDVKGGIVSYANVTGGYGKPINPYGLTPDEQKQVYAELQKKGGSRYGKTRVKRKEGTTRKYKKDPLQRYGQHFSSLWKVFGSICKKKDTE